MAASNAPAMIITMIVCTVSSFLFMGLRFYCKQYLGTKLALDDAVLAFSWLLFLTYIVISIYTTKFGLGAHVIDIDPTLLPEALYLMPIGQFFAVVSVAVSKSSFIITLLRLVRVDWQKWALWFMLATINASMLSISIVQFYQCSVPAAPGCVDGTIVIGLGCFAAGYSAVMDLVLTIFPSMVIWNVQMKSREKIGIITSMSLGVIAGVVGLYKTTTIPYVARNADFTYGTAIVLIWLVAEVTATIMAASIPFYRPLVRKIAVTSKTPTTPSYGMTPRSRGCNKLGSQADVKSGFPADDSSDKGIIASADSRIVRKTNITVEYDNYHVDEERAEDPQPHHKRRDMF